MLSTDDVLQKYAEAKKYKGSGDLRKHKCGSLLLDRYLVKKQDVWNKDKYSVCDQTNKERNLEVTFFKSFDAFWSEYFVLKSLQARMDRQRSADAGDSSKDENPRIIEVCGVLSLDTGKSYLFQNQEKHSDDEEKQYFFIRPANGRLLMQFIKEKLCMMKNQNVYKIGLQVLDLIEAVHSTGYVYNNINLNSIALNPGQQMNVTKDGHVTFEESMNLNLINFKDISPYLDNITGRHIKQEKVK